MNELTALLNRPPVSAWDVLDILIVSLLIYEALKLIRGTRAMQMAIGSVIVLFQSDIRRALSQLGRTPFFRWFARHEREVEAIEEILTATAMLSKGRVGAIIAIEREIGLRNYIESGIPVDARVSYDLLTTIFQPTTPMHDGAVIISEERIAAALSPRLRKGCHAIRSWPRPGRARATPSTSGRAAAAPAAAGAASDRRG